MGPPIGVTQIQQGHNQEPLQYSREFLLLLRDAGTGVVGPRLLTLWRSPGMVPLGGDRSWAKEAEEPACARGLKSQAIGGSPFISIILTSVHSLRNKVDNLQANVKFISEYRNSCLIAQTETWLKQQDLQSDLEIDSFGEPL